MKQKQEFYDKYPELFPKGEPYCGFHCDHGWWPIIDKLCSGIKAELDIVNADTDDKSEIIVAQVKEKFGGLRFYIDEKSSNEAFKTKIRSLIKDAESQSECTCEKCGQPGSLTKIRAYVVTMCNQCETNAKSLKK